MYNLALSHYIVGLTVWQIENFLPVAVDECKMMLIIKQVLF